MARARAGLARALRLERPLPFRLPLDADDLLFARQRERMLRRVAAAAELACEERSLGLDVDDAMRRLRAELRTAAEFEAQAGGFQLEPRAPVLPGACSSSYELGTGRPAGTGGCGWTPWSASPTSSAHA